VEGMFVVAATLGTVDVLIRVLLAAALGALVGAERQWRSHAAGARTHALVASGAALFTLAGAYGFPDIPRTENVDPMRVAAQVASGIGFVGAGAIIRNGLSIKGLTTAATLWASAAVGVAAGAGFYPGALVGFAVVLALLVLLRQAWAAFPFARPKSALVERNLVVDYERGHGTMAELLETLVSAHVAVQGIGIQDDGDRSTPGTRRTIVRVAGELGALSAIAEELSDVAEINAVEIQPCDAPVRSTEENGSAVAAGGTLMLLKQEPSSR